MSLHTDVRENVEEAHRRNTGRLTVLSSLFDVLHSGRYHERIRRDCPITDGVDHGSVEFWDGLSVILRDVIEDDRHMLTAADVLFRLGIDGARSTDALEG